jgi:hypothetical protein
VKKQKWFANTSKPLFKPQNFEKSLSNKDTKIKERKHAKILFQAI